MDSGLLVASAILAVPLIVGVIMWRTDRRHPRQGPPPPAEPPSDFPPSHGGGAAGGGGAGG